MPLAPANRFSSRHLTPYIAPELAVQLAAMFQASQSLPLGTPLGRATSGVSAVHTVSISGTPTGGTFQLAYGGFTTSALANNAAAADVQAALEALPSIGTGNVACTGGALPGTPVVCTFQGALASRPVALMTVATSALTGGTNPAVTTALTTAGVLAGGLKAWNGALVAPPVAPTVSAVAGGSVFGDGTNPFAYLIQVTFYNETGETTPSPASQVVVSTTNRTIRVGAYASVGSTVQGARVYANGVLIKDIAASGGNIAQTDIATIVGGASAPNTNGAYQVRDGSHIIRGFALVDMTTDGDGKVIYGLNSSGGEHGEKYNDGPMWVSGYFRMGDLVGATSYGAQLATQVKFLTFDYTDAEAILKFG